MKNFEKRQEFATLDGTMGRSNKNKGTENQQQQRDNANDDAIASGSHMEASGEHTIGTQLSEAPTVADIMSAINNLSQNVDKRFDSLQTSIADFNQTMGGCREEAIQDRERTEWARDPNQSPGGPVCKVGRHSPKH